MQCVALAVALVVGIPTRDRNPSQSFLHAGSSTRPQDAFHLSPHESAQPAALKQVQSRARPGLGAAAGGDGQLALLAETQQRQRHRHRHRQRPDAHLIHVGKTGGGVVNDLLSQANRQALHSWFKRAHVRSSLLRDADVTGGSLWLITVRDPVDRLVSAFNWKYINVSKPSSRRGFESDFYGCFQSVAAFVDALGGSDNCSRIAQDAFGNFTYDGCHAIVSHQKDSWFQLCKGFGYYLSEVMSGLEDPVRNASVYLTRTESLQADCDGLRDWLRLPDLRTSLTDLADTHESCGRHGLCDTTLSDSRRLKLRGWLQPEYELLSRLEAVAVNGKAARRPRV